MPRYSLKRAQRAALMALGENGDSVIANLEAVGLVIVHKADLPQERHEPTRRLTDVRLELPDHWSDPYNALVISPELDEPTEYGCEFDAIHSVREAYALQRTLGYAVDLHVDDQAGLITQATARDS